MSDLLKQVAEPHNYPSTTLIYGLVDPRTDYIRYVGKANKPKTRLAGHLAPSQIKRNTPKINWLNELRSEGKKPDIVILEEVSYGAWQDTERKWIQHYRSLPDYPPLTNIGDGGECGTASVEVVKRAAARRVGVPMPPGTGEKISQANRGRIIGEKARAASAEYQRNRWKKASNEEREKMLDNLQKGRLWPESKRKQRGLDARSAERKQGSTSRYRNVIMVIREGKTLWKAGCIIDGRQIHIGYFDTEEESAKARDKFILKYIGEEVPLNFPRSEYSDSDISSACQKPRRSDNTSGYRGVVWYKSTKRWRCSAQINKRKLHLGFFPGTEQGKIDAARTFDRWAIEHLDKFAYTNFPRSDYE